MSRAEASDAERSSVFCQSQCVLLRALTPTLLTKTGTYACESEQTNEERQAIQQGRGERHEKPSSRRGEG